MNLQDITTEIQLETTEGSFKNKDGKVIFTRQWSLKNQAPRAIIFVCHGFGEHSDRYSDFLAPALVAEGFFVISHDHVGHGRSEGERAQIHTFDTYIRDVFHDIDHVAAKYPSLPVFLFGHSMGGAIGILSAMQRPKFFTGLVLSGPAIMADPDMDTKCLRCLGRIAVHLVPSLQVLPAIDPATTSRNPEKVEAYRTDPLVWHGGVKARWGMAITHTMDTIQEKIGEIEWPFLVLQGDADRLIMAEGAILLEKKAKSKDKTIKIYEGYYHELLNEPREYAEIVRNDIIEWLRKRMLAAS